MAAPAASAHPRNYYHYHDWGAIEENTKRTRTKYDWKHCKKIKTTTWMSPHGRQKRRKVTRILTVESGTTIMIMTMTIMTIMITSGLVSESALISNQ